MTATKRIDKALRNLERTVTYLEAAEQDAQEAIYEARGRAIAAESDRRAASLELERAKRVRSRIADLLA